MLRIESDEKSLLVKASGDFPGILTEFTLAARQLYDGIGDDNKEVFKMFLEDLFPAMVCEPDKDFSKLAIMSIMKHSMEEE